MLIQVIYEETMDRARSALRAVHPEADAVELRLDPLGDCEPAGLLRKSRVPTLVTSRSRASGGAFRGDPEQRLALLRHALQEGADYVDLEFGTEDERLIPARGRSKVILSAHFPEGMPEDLEGHYARMAGVGGVDVLKIVPYADSITDNLRIRNLLRRARRDGRSLIAFCMGPKGTVSRLLALRWGSWATFGATVRGRESASGQFTVEELSQVFRVKDLGRGTRLLGILGSPLGHSLSPVVHNRALRKLQLDYCYLPFEAEVLGEFLPFLEELDITGFSVTLPHKTGIRKYLDELDEEARKLGSVNTVVKRWNRFLGYNTDVPAAVRLLRGITTLEGRRVALLGAGGAGRALAHGLKNQGARVTIHNRTVERARRVAEEVGCGFASLDACGRGSWDILINATPVGMAPATEKVPVPPRAIRAAVVFDLIYNPPETRLLSEARRRGCRILGGLEMFLEQAKHQFRLFTGHDAPVGEMRRAAEEALGIRSGRASSDD